MLKGKTVVVADFGSSKINVFAGVANAYNNLNILAKCEQEYEGYIGGKFIEIDKVGKAFLSAINVIQASLNQKITKIHVSVPSEFCFLTTNTYSVNFKLKTKILQKQLDFLFNQPPVKHLHGKTLINKSAISFDMDGQSVIKPLGMQAKTLDAKISEVYAENYFIDLLISIVENLNIELEFLCSPLAQGHYLLDERQKQNGAIIVDCGFISTSVSYHLGEGLTELKSFSLGGGHITSDLQEILNLPYAEAEQLKQKLILTIKPSPLDEYSLNVSGKTVGISVKTANDIALARIEVIANAINKCLKSFKTKLADDEVIHITGGGLAYLKGIKNYLTKALKRKVVILAPTPMQFNKPHLSSTISLLHVAINS